MTYNSTNKLSVYNTTSKRIDPFVPIHDNEVGLYTCGPTVYHYAHIGNMRTYIFEDILRRTLDHIGYNVKHVMNITDVGHLQSDADEGDDKMMVASLREKKSPWQIARFYEEEFLRHSSMLNIRRPHVICRATEHIPEMIKMVQTLVEKEYAYLSDGNVYFDVSKFDRYTEFAGLTIESQIQTERVDHDSRKRNQSDFVLWFSQSKYPHQIMKWDSPWGVGFPGWHIECSAMATKYLGEHFDIHCGGIDHIRVHHTNEIAQSECCNNQKWVNYWLHGEFLNVDDGKMSKSKGDTLTVDTLVRDGFSPLDYRYFLLIAHYRSAVSFSYAGLNAAKNSRQNLVSRIQEWKSSAHDDSVNDISTEAIKYKKQFWDAVYNDLHVPQAVAIAWGVAKNTELSVKDKLALFYDFDQVLGLNLSDESKPVVVLTNEQQKLVNEREYARMTRNWAEADRIRDILLTQGIQLKDSAKKGQGPEVTPYP